MKEWIWNNQEWLTPIAAFIRDHKIATFLIVFFVISLVPMLISAIGEIFDYIVGKRKVDKKWQ